MTFEKGQRVSATTKDHGHLAAAKVKGFTGIVEGVGSEMIFPLTGETYRIVGIRLEPSLKAIRYFNTRKDNIEVVG